jgi:muramoyltetrapeptide carboxypeptidase
MTRRPPALRPGDTVAVVAPAAAVDRASLDHGIEALESLGYRARVVPEVHLRNGYLAGPDAARAASLRQALRDPTVRAIFFARAGYGSARLLPLLARGFARSRPKILLGYSDATALLSYATSKHGWITFHGPMVATDFAALGPRDRRSLTDLLNGRPTLPIPLRATLRPGIAEGKLVGGCLSILVSLLGTPYALDPRGGLLFLEDQNEKPYRLDRMLTQLRQASMLSKVRGLVLGEMPGCGSAREIRRVVTDVTQGLDYPVAMGLPSGHGRGKLTVPLGARARLDTRRRQLEILEPVVQVDR